MPAVTMDDVRRIIEDIIKRDYSTTLNSRDLELMSSQCINRSLGRKLDEDTYDKMDTDDILSVSVAAFNPNSGILQFADGPIDPLAHRHQSVDANTLYNLGSISKWLIMVMCIRLLEKEKLSLDDTISTFLNESGIPNASTITIKNLLGHYSGLKDSGFTALSENEPLSKLLKDDSVSVIAKNREKQFYYANINFTILAKIICKIMQLNLQECLDELIAIPLELHHLKVIDAASEADQHSVGYKSNEGTKQLVNGSGHYIYGATSFRSTPSDLVKLMYHFFHDDTFISPFTRELVTASPHDVMFEVITKTDTYQWPAVIGLGIERRSIHINETNQDIPIFCHGGWQDSHAAFLAYSPETQTAYCCAVTKTQGLERVLSRRPQTHALLFSSNINNESESPNKTVSQDNKAFSAR